MKCYQLDENGKETLLFCFAHPDPMAFWKALRQLNESFKFRSITTMSFGNDLLTTRIHTCY